MIGILAGQDNPEPGEEAMSHEMRRIEQSGQYEIVGLVEMDRGSKENSLLFVRHAGAPQAIFRDTIPEALETAILLNRVLNVYHGGVTP